MVAVRTTSKPSLFVVIRTQVSSDRNKRSTTTKTLVQSLPCQLMLAIAKGSPTQTILTSYNSIAPKSFVPYYRFHAARHAGCVENALIFEVT